MLKPTRHPVNTTINIRGILAFPCMHTGKKARNQYGAGDKNTLTKTEKEVMALITKEFLTPSQIATKRGCSKRTVQWHLSNIRKKGFITKAGEGYGENPYVPPCMPPPVTTKNIRLHGEEFNIKLVRSSAIFERLSKKGVTLSIGGNTVRLFSSSLEVYSGRSFWGVDAQECDSVAVRYWSLFFARLEHEFNVLILKERKPNIRRVKAHYADVDNVLALDLDRKGERLRVKDSSGREWLLVDGSWGFRELETVHSSSSKVDMQEVVSPFFNDLRDNRGSVRLPSQVSSELDQLRSIISELAVSQKNMSVVLESLLPSPVVSSGFDSSLADYFG